VTIPDHLRAFIVENFYVSDPEALTDDLSLIDSGLVDSTGMLEVILHLEATYGIKVEDRETIPANFETLGRITAFVTRKLDGGVPYHGPAGDPTIG
jgi:acyl carrier protein